MTDITSFQTPLRPPGTIIHSSRARVKRVMILVPACLLGGGAALSILDVRLALLASVIVIGWTQLVGL